MKLVRFLQNMTKKSLTSETDQSISMRLSAAHKVDQFLKKAIYWLFVVIVIGVLAITLSSLLTSV